MAAAALGVVAAVAVVSSHWGHGGRHSGLLQIQRGSHGGGDAWEQGYLFAKPGKDNLNYDYEHYGHLVGGRRMRGGRGAVAQQQLMQQHRFQVLCGTGAGCESENEWIIKEAANLNRTAVYAGHGGANTTVPDKIVDEVKAAMEQYAKELDYEKNYQGGSPFNEFKTRGKQQLLREVFPPGSKRGGKSGLAARTHKLCVIGSACEQWADMQIHIAEQMDHDRVNEGRPDPPSDETMAEVQRAMEEQKINPARRVASGVAVPLPPY